MPDFVYVEKPKRGIAVLTMAKEPVNSLDLDMWERLEAALKELEADPSVRGVIIQSGLKRGVFSAGNDIMALYAPATSSDAYEKFWITQNRFLVRLLTTRLVTCAAVRGACPAGGCIIALCCDIRLAMPCVTIGLNEVLLGIPVPKFWGHLMAQRIGLGAAEKLLLMGTLVQADKAVDLGLLDLVVQGGASELLASAVGAVEKAIKLPSHSYHSTKLNLRQQFASKWEAYYPGEARGAWPLLEDPQTVKALKATLERLSQKKPPQPKL